MTESTTYPAQINNFIYLFLNRRHNPPKSLPFTVYNDFLYFHLSHKVKKLLQGMELAKDSKQR